MSRIDVWLKENGLGNVVHQEFVGGGCINDSMRLHLDSGTTVFLKQNSAAPEGMFQAEAIGLQALATRNAIKIPDVIHVLADGKICRSGGKELAVELEEKGYAEYSAAAE